ncbi:membrane-bound ClpP family serine protease [Weissella beninensis]|uniref:NADH dehydrogenase subunit 6 n=1 Tax=Periweissella beninensis TaxID=504936 RepID=A0ABT0VKN8_9LACO|nr:hypothetical protein [Periweissella beninensis]MBM7544782.1 membrane-bound ClpP family serine protease [Periweissella beninensis]MCM2437020.1 hypothetical protein [Periweissella beninensis]
MQKAIKCSLSGIIMVIFSLASLASIKFHWSMMITISVFIFIFIISSLLMTFVVIWLQKQNASHNKNSEEA